MKSFSRIALGAGFALAGAAGMAAAPAAAQQAAAPSLSGAERQALHALQTAIEQRDYATAAAAAAAARSTVRSRDAVYYAGALELRLGNETNNSTFQAQGIEAMLRSGAVPTANLGQLYKNQAALALSAGRYQEAERLLASWVQAAPNDPEALLALAEIKDVLRKGSEAVTLVDRAIDIRTAAGQRAPESWYKRGLKHAVDAQLAGPSIKFSQGLLANYPSPKNWRDALLIYNELTPPDPEARLDAMRLMRSANALSGERDYLQLAQALSSEGLPGESKAVLDEGVAAKMVDPAKATFKELIASTGKRAAADKKALASQASKAMAAASGTAALEAGDAHFAFGDYDKAAELYRAAVQKGSVDANVANTRLGMALALAGQAAEAQAALRAVNGTRGPLASYWLLWLAQGGAA